MCVKQTIVIPDVEVWDRVELGVGGFGVVYKAKLLITNNIVLVQALSGRRTLSVLCYFNNYDGKFGIFSEHIPVYIIIY